MASSVDWEFSWWDCSWAFRRENMDWMVVLVVGWKPSHSNLFFAKEEIDHG
jgi:hypothetical protein